MGRRGASMSARGHSRSLAMQRAPSRATPRNAQAACGLRARRGTRSLIEVREEKKQPSVKERLETVKGRIQEVVDQAREGHAFRRQGAATATEERAADG